MRINYISRSTGIKDYNSSTLAKNERGDCVVAAVASASEWEYDKAHKFVSDWFKRKPRRGTRFFKSSMNRLEKENKRLNRKKVTVLSNGEMKNGKSKMTIGAFAKIYKKGSYIVAVKGHVFTIKDGNVIGNYEDATKTRKILKGAWRVGSL